MTSAKQKKDQSVVRVSLQKLHQCADEFNAWRRSQGGRWIRLTDQCFDGMNLEGVDFTGVKLSRSTFRKANLRNAKFLAANINLADLTEADISGCDFFQARMHSAILADSIATNVNFYGAIRDGWNVRGIKCKKCWIARNRYDFGDSPELFSEGEFENVYGGKRIRVNFPGGFAPIDLLALPFYAQSIIEQFPDKKIVFAGLSTLGDPCLEFRIESTESESAMKDIAQKDFSEAMPHIRDTVSRLLDLIERKDEEFDFLLKRLPLQHPMTMYINNSTIGNLTNQSNQGSGIQMNHCHDFDPSVDLNQITGELDKLIESLERINTCGSVDEDLVCLKKAKKAADQGRCDEIYKHLKTAGEWLVEFSSKIGAKVLSEIILNSIRMH